MDFWFGFMSDMYWSKDLYSSSEVEEKKRRSGAMSFLFASSSITPTFKYY